LLLTPMIAMNTSLCSRMRRIFTIGEIVSTLLWAVAFIGLAATSRQTDKSIHNAIFAFDLGQSVIQTLFLVTLFAWIMRQLEVRLLGMISSESKQGVQQSTIDLAKTLNRGRKGLVLSAVSNMCPLMYLQ